MDKEIYIRVKDVPIEDVIGKYIRLDRPLCPFHGDRKPGSFSIDKRRNRFRCFACGASGDAADFVSLYKGISLYDAALEILDEQEICSSSKPAMQSTGIKVNVKRPEEYLDKVYRAFVKAAPPLTEEHYGHLKDKRKITGFSCFFEWPRCDAAFFEKFLIELKNEGISGTLPELLDSVPGFFYSQGYGTKFTEYDGIGIILTNAERKISGLQVRRDNINGSSKYKLFSSSFADINTLEDENIRGASLGQVSDFTFPEGKSLGFAVTEGKFKAIALASKGLTALSLNGVTAQEPVEDILKLAAGKTEVIYIAFDMDMFTNDGVKKEACRLCRQIELKGFKPVFMTWPAECGKGIDDFLSSGADTDMIQYIPDKKMLER